MSGYRPSKVEPLTQSNGAQALQQLQHKDEEKMPVFLIKLWNIVEDPGYQQIIRWDESGYSFHILDPYSFCKNILPHYFKHNNLNSLIRQLNMYGFRKMTPIDRSGLTRSESDQDHLEFSHPYFVRDHPELLVNIKRKPSGRQAETSSQSTVTVQAKELNLVLDELRQLREKQRNVEMRMEQITKENEQVWSQLSHMQATHMKQQQVVNKLVQFLVALVQPSGQKRMTPKRGLLAIDEPLAKRTRSSASSSNLSENEPSSSGAAGPSSASGSRRLGGRGGFGVSGFDQNAYIQVLDRLQRELSEGGVSPILSPNGGPIIAEVTDDLASQPSSSFAYPAGPGTSGQQPQVMTRAMQRQMAQGQTMPKMEPPMYQPRQMQQPNLQQQRDVIDTFPEIDTSSAERPEIVQGASPEPPSANLGLSPLHPTICMSPSLDRQISNELQEYLNDVDAGIGNCRDILGGQWDLDFPEEAWNALEEGLGSSGQSGSGYGQQAMTSRQGQLMLEGGAHGTQPTQFGENEEALADDFYQPYSSNGEEWL